MLLVSLSCSFVLFSYPFILSSLSFHSPLTPLPCHSLLTSLSFLSHSPFTPFSLPTGKPIHQHPQPKARLRGQTHILPEGNERLPLLPPREGRNASLLHSHPRSPPRTSPRRACTAAFSPQQRMKRSSASASPPPSSSSAATSRRIALACPSPST